MPRALSCVGSFIHPTACRAFVLKLDFIFSSSSKSASHGAPRYLWIPPKYSVEAKESLLCRYMEFLHPVSLSICGVFEYRCASTVRMVAEPDHEQARQSFYSRQHVIFRLMKSGVTQIELTNSGRRVPDHSFHYLIMCPCYT